MVDSSMSSSKTRRFVIETHSIDHVPASERHAKMAHQPLFWFTSNFQLFMIATGFIGPSMGLGFGWTTLATVTGILFGMLFMALHASQGPDLGLPQMIQSRAQFGYRGVIIALLACFLTCVGFNIVNIVLIGQGLNHLLGWNYKTVAITLCLGATVIAIYGHDWLHGILRRLFWLTVPLYMALSWAIMDGTVAASGAAASGFSWIGFAAQFAACASVNITFAPYVSDYTRYLPRGRSRAALIWIVFFGASLSAIWLIILGAWFAAYMGATDAIVALNGAANRIAPHFGTVILLISVAGLAAMTALNAYSGMLAVVTGIDCFRKTTPNRTIRIYGILIISVIYLGISLAVSSSAVDAEFAMLSFLLYMLAPWTAINLMDYFFIRKGQYRTEDFFTLTGPYGVWAWRGLTAYAIGFSPACHFSIWSVFMKARLPEPWATSISPGRQALSFRRRPIMCSRVGKRLKISLCNLQVVQKNVGVKEKMKDLAPTILRQRLVIEGLVSNLFQQMTFIAI